MLSSLLSAPGSLFAEFDRLQRELQQAFTTPSSIRAVARGSFPAVNIGMTPASVEVYAFVPGIDPSTLDVSVDRGLLSISGQRTEQNAESQQEGGASTQDVNVYVRERFTGSFRRVISLPDDVDIGRIEAVYRDGVLRVSVARREEAQPRRITVN